MCKSHTLQVENGDLMLFSVGVWVKWSDLPLCYGTLSQLLSAAQLRSAPCCHVPQFYPVATGVAGASWDLLQFNGRRKQCGIMGVAVLMSCLLQMQNYLTPSNVFTDSPLPSKTFSCRRFPCFKWCSAALTVSSGSTWCDLHAEQVDSLCLTL